MKPASAIIREWRANPVRFVQQCIGATPDDWQEEVLNAALTHQRIALKASKGPGKSTVMSWLGWWFLATRPNPKVIATSISAANLRDGLWTEFTRWQNQSPFLKEGFLWSAERIVARGSESTWWASARAWSQSADPGQQANALAGIHADHLMFLVDEAGGIPDAVVGAAEAGLANADPARGTEALLVLAGNPTHLSGPLYRACTRERSLWFVKEISGDPDDPKRAKRVSLAWAQEQKAKWGPDHPYYLVNVLGKFPPGQSNTLMGVEEVTAATQRVYAEHEYAEEVKVLGVDVARFGDDRTVLFTRQGRVAFEPRIFRNIDTMETAGQVARMIREFDPDATFIDQTGVGGGVVDRLLELHYPVIGVDNAGKPSDSQYLNKRIEMWSDLAQWIRKGGRIPNGELVAELATPTYKFNSGGQWVLESKADMKKRGLPSPDLADALALTFAWPVARRDIRAGLQQANAQRNQTEYDPYAEAN